ncbi:MAG TPA: branched-chain amino acid ABC transporter permease [Actinomycetota bacterium]|nr:branched-chain amino acid ABC transporter permease [Actinomycetota bacterium]
MNALNARRSSVGAGILLAIAIPAFFSDAYRSLAALSAIAGILILSLNLLTGFVGQISFCQYTFAGLGAMTVGALSGGQGHHWSFWISMPLGVLFAALGGLLVGIPALRLSGLFLAILTLGVALGADRYLFANGTWNSFTGGVNPRTPARPTLFGFHLTGEYQFYLFALAVFLLVALIVWNLRVGKTGRVLRAIRESEVAASTMGLNLTRWKLAAFTSSAAIAGLGGCLLAVQIGSVSPASYDFLHSITLAAIVVVAGVGSIASAAIGGIFLWWLPELLSHLGIHNTQFFPLLVGVLLIIQLVFSPQGGVVKLEHDLKKLLKLDGRKGAHEPELAEVL